MSISAVINEFPELAPRLDSIYHETSTRLFTLEIRVIELETILTNTLMELDARIPQSEIARHVRHLLAVPHRWIAYRKDL